MGEQLAQGDRAPLRGQVGQALGDGVVEPEHAWSTRASATAPLNAFEVLAIRMWSVLRGGLRRLGSPTPARYSTVVRCRPPRCHPARTTPRAPDRRGVSRRPRLSHLVGRTPRQLHHVRYQDLHHPRTGTYTLDRQLLLLPQSVQPLMVLTAPDPQTLEALDRLGSADSTRAMPCGCYPRPSGGACRWGRRDA